MKRDEDALRAILEAVESVEDPLSAEQPDWEELSSKYGEPKLLHHVALLVEEEFIRVVDRSNLAKAGALKLPSATSSLEEGRLTWRGHDLLEKLRKEGSTPQLS